MQILVFTEHHMALKCSLRKNTFYNKHIYLQQLLLFCIESYMLNIE